MQNALSPSLKALVADQLLRHADADVRAAVASCLSEIMRITAPDAPYDDDKMNVRRKLADFICLDVVEALQFHSRVLTSIFLVLSPFSCRRPFSLLYHHLKICLTSPADLMLRELRFLKPQQRLDRAW